MKQNKRHETSKHETRDDQMSRVLLSRVPRQNNIL